MRHLMQANRLDRPISDSVVPTPNEALYWEGRRAAIMDMVAWMNSGVLKGHLEVYPEVEAANIAIENQIYAHKNEKEDEL